MFGYTSMTRVTALLCKCRMPRDMGSKANNNKLQNIRKQDILHNNGCGDVFSSHFL